MKMCRKIVSLLAVLILALALAAPAFAADYPLVNDTAGLLTADEAAGLEQRCEEISDKWNSDVVIVTVNSLEGKTATAYANDYFDYNGFGRGSDRSGIVFLLSMEDRDWCMSARGWAITAFTDYGRQYIFEQMQYDLSEDNYAAALDTYAAECGRFMEQAANGEPFDTDNLADPKSYAVCILIGLCVGAVTAGIVCLIFAAELKTKVPQREASSYVRPGSAHITRRQDMFLYSHTQRVRKQENSGGGGSTTHISSSGAVHSSSSGKF
jgi:uncharacterized protein